MRHGPSGGLQVIFAIFLGLMVTAFIGVGVYTFYPPPHEETRALMTQLHREEQDITSMRSADSMTPEERTRLDDVRTRRRALEDQTLQRRKVWGRTTSIVLVALATLTMVLSLWRPEHLPVISNGLLLGGVFTMVYGVGWIITSDASGMRFVVLTAALAITLGVGYARFVRPPRAAAGGEGRAPQPDDIAALASRVDALEARIAAAVSALRDGKE
jgi:hypothetical protein